MIYGAPGDRNLSRLLPLLRRTARAAARRRAAAACPGGGRSCSSPVHVADAGGRGAGARLPSAPAPRRRRDLRPGRAGAADLRRAAAHGRAGGRQPDPVHPGAAGPGAGRRPRLRAGQPEAPDQGRAGRSAWPRTRRSPIHAAARDLGFAPRSFADGIRPRPAPWASAAGQAGGQRPAGRTPGELAPLGRTAAHLRPAQIAHRARLRAQAAALHRLPQAGERLLQPAPAGRPAACRAGPRASARWTPPR